MQKRHTASERERERVESSWVRSALAHLFGDQRRGEDLEGRSVRCLGERARERCALTSDVCIRRIHSLCRDANLGGGQASGQLKRADTGRIKNRERVFTSSNTADAFPASGLAESTKTLSLPLCQVAHVNNDGRKGAKK